MTIKLKNIHPGEVLLEEFLLPMLISQNMLARDIGVPPRRINEIVALQHKHQFEKNSHEIGKEYEVLAEGISKKSTEHFFGRNSQSTVIVFPRKNFKKGDYVTVKVTDFTSATLIAHTL